MVPADLLRLPRQRSRLDQPTEKTMKLITFIANNVVAEMVEDSLGDHDKWLHRYCRNEKKATSIVPCGTDSLTTDPNDVLAHEAAQWADQWRQRDTKKVAECVQSVIKLRQSVLSQYADMPIGSPPARNKETAGGASY